MADVHLLGDGGGGVVDDRTTRVRVLRDAVGGIGDQLVWSAIKARRYPHANTGAATLNYRTSFACHYQARNEVPPPGDARPI